MKKLTISIDFDGIINMAEYPAIKPFNKTALHHVRYWCSRGHTVIINSCRKLSIIREYRISLDIDPRALINQNNPENIKKYGGDCRKIYADVYIDDHNILQIGKPVDFELYDKIIRRLEHGEV